eukprot:1873678-Rhodomonas_salina.1
MVDDQEYVFGDRDFTPGERKVIRMGLREFLCDGQDTWRRDGGVKPKPRGLDPEVKKILDWVPVGMKRRPKRVLKPGTDPQ